MGLLFFSISCLRSRRTRPAFVSGFLVLLAGQWYIASSSGPSRPEGGERGQLVHSCCGRLAEQSSSGVAEASSQHRRHEAAEGDLEMDEDVHWVHAKGAMQQCAF